MAVAAPAHRMNQIVMPEERGPAHAGELRALIRVDQHPVLRLSPPHSHEQSLQHDVGGLAALYRPADDDGEIGEALTGPDISDVRDPRGVWNLDVELPVERVIYNDRRPAAVYAGPAFVANLRPYPGNACPGVRPGSGSTSRPWSRRSLCRFR